MGNRQITLTKLCSMSSGAKPRVQRRFMANQQQKVRCADESTVGCPRLNQHLTESASPESVMTDFERDEASYDSLRLESLTLDNHRVFVDFSKLPDDHNNLSVLQPVRSESGRIGFGIDASFIESSQQFSTRRHREELICT